MLETKNLCKIYKPKKGVPVTALDKISLKFPDKGMVFLLGKSGSGKSTLLNLLGGLDRYDSGEIIIKGVSSKDFKQKHFDSYRNTYVGFIFQEYNVLEEFSVGANIALAIELQNRKASDEEINEILREVDLEGYGNRKPNELSGGQKQRVAIARALVKKPEIIMADEPTGALDSNTGRQVLETLKRLSKKKLVIIVSHDRDFAECYADRIIELADGRVISDMEVDSTAPAEEKTALIYDGQEIQVPAGYHLTEEDRLAINAYITDLQADATVHIGRKKSGKKFAPTDTAKIKPSDAASFHLIKSKLPMKNALKIGASGLGHKKIRLVVTILLSCIAFGLFGLADTFGAYNHVKTCTNSIYDTEIKYASIVRSRKIGSGINEYWKNYGNMLAQDQIDTFTKDTGIDMAGVYVPNTSLSFESQIDPEVELTQTEVQIYSQSFTGFAEITEETLQTMNANLVAGKLPDGSKNEIAISTYVFQTFQLAKYSDGTYSIGDNNTFQYNYTQIQYYDDMVGKTLHLNGTDYTVTGVIDTGLDLDRYKYLTEARQNISAADKIVDYALANEFGIASTYSLAGLAMVGEGHMDILLADRAPIYDITHGYLYFDSSDAGMSIDPSYLTTLDQISDQNITWIDGEKTTLADNEIIVTANTMGSYGSGNSVIIYGTDTAQGPEAENDSSNYTGILKNASFSKDYYSETDLEFHNEEGYKIVGILEIDKNNAELAQATVVSDKDFNAFTDGKDAVYSFAVGEMPESKEAISDVVSYCYGDENKTERFELQNSVTYELDTVNSVLHTLADVFLYIGLGFALFAALMLANFISTSISYKKQDIGILRAIGSRGNDVFRIFFAESFIIAMINFVVSSIGVFTATTIINYFIRHKAGILITILNFGIRQLLLLLVVSLAVAALASYVPVKRIASKRPIDAIRNR